MDSVTGSTLSYQFRQARIKLTLIIGLALTIVLLLSSLNIYQNTRIGFDAYRQRIRQGIIRARLQQPNLPPPTEFEPYAEDLAFVVRVLTFNNLILLSILIFATWVGLYFLLKPLDESVRQREKFVAEAGHELRTPLAILYSELSLSQSENDPKKLKKVHKESLTEIKRLQNLSNSLLDRHLPDDEIQEKLNIAQTIQQVWHKLQKSGLYGKNLILNISPLISDLEITTQKASFWHIIYNILENVFKHAPTDSKLEVEINTVDQELIFRNICKSDQSNEASVGSLVLSDMCQALGLKIRYELKGEYFVTILSYSNSK